MIVETRTQRRVWATLVALFSVLIMSLLFAPNALATSSAAPAESNAAHSVTRDGVTFSWTDEEFADLQITETPGVADSADSAEDAALGDVMNDAYRDSMEIAQNTEPTTLANNCSFSPEGWGGAQFSNACLIHDQCYGNDRGIDRLECDKQFHANLKNECQKAYPNNAPGATECDAVVQTYYNTVRALGGNFYKGNGANN